MASFNKAKKALNFVERVTLYVLELVAPRDGAAIPHGDMVVAGAAADAVGEQES